MNDRMGRSISLFLPEVLSTDLPSNRGWPSHGRLMSDIRREAPLARLPINRYLDPSVRLDNQYCGFGEGCRSSSHGHCPVRASNRMRSRCGYLTAVNLHCAVPAECLKIFYLIRRFLRMVCPLRAHRITDCSTPSGAR